MKKRISILLIVCLIIISLNPLAVYAKGLSISQSSMTIKTGQSVRLTVNASNCVWISSEPGVASVSQNGTVTGKSKGSTVITVSNGSSSAECIVSVVKGTSSSTTRYNVLIIDTSGSIKGMPFKRLKEASKKFAKTVLNADGNNYVAIVALNTKSRKVLGFTKSIKKVNKAINKLKATGNTNMNGAFVSANKLLASKKGGSKVIKNIILCSDGLPETGTTSAKGRYKKSDHKYYNYANATYKTDVKSKNRGYFVYALGFFHNSKGSDLVFGKRLMKDLASKDKYYIITKPKDVNKVLKNIATTITKTKCSKSSLTLWVGQTAKLQYLVNGSARKASWRSGNSSVASVNGSGKVKAKKKGKTTITGTVDGRKVTCKVTVKEKKKKKKASTKLNKSSITVYVGKTKKLTATVKGSSKKVTWKTTDKSIATVNSKGVVKGKKAGTCYVKATANGKTATCKVKVIIKHPDYSQYFEVKKMRSNYGSAYINEYGCHLIFNKGAKITRCAVYVKKVSSNTYHRTIACKGKNISWVKYVPYLANNGKIKYDGEKTYGINTYYLSQDSYGVWSYKGRYEMFIANLKDASGRPIVARKVGVETKNTKYFTKLSKMKAYMKK